MADPDPNLPGEAQFEEFENEEVGAGAEQAEEGAARSAVPEVPHMVEVKVPLAMFYRDMTEWQKKAPEYDANATMNAIDRIGYEPFVHGKSILRSGNAAVSQGLVTVPVSVPMTHNERGGRRGCGDARAYAAPADVARRRSNRAALHASAAPWLHAALLRRG